jgi:L-aminopeptidase/D-esterase-like protein
MVVAAARRLRHGSAAADCLARAVMRALVAAEPLAGVAGRWQRCGRMAGPG